MDFSISYDPGPTRKRPDRKQTQIMSHKMKDVIKSYVNRYSQEGGYYSISNEDIIKNISMIVSPLMITILNKYSEVDFHNAMKKRYYDENGYVCWGFDYIGDIKRNHPLAFSLAMMYARIHKKKLNFNVNVASELMIDIMYSWQWHVWPHEKEAVHHMLYRIKKLIQSS